MLEPGRNGYGNLPEVRNNHETGYKWLSLFKEQGAAGLAELSRASKNNANKIHETVKKRLLKLKEKHKYWGAYKILTVYTTKYPEAYALARSAVEELFRKERYTGRKKRTRENGRAASGAGKGERTE